MQRIPEDVLLHSTDEQLGLTTTVCKEGKRPGRQITDLTGKKFGKITVIRKTDKRQHGSVIWLCECECSPGEYFGVRSASLVQGNVRSCGCAPKWQHKVLKDQFQPGCERLYIYRAWYCMKIRCVNAVNMGNKRKVPKLYQELKLKVFPEWLDFENFYAWALHNNYTLGASLQRNDLYANYTPENCYWQAYGEPRNNKPGHLLLEYRGQTQSLTAWARELGMPINKLRYRLSVSGWDMEKTMNTVWDHQHRVEAGRATRLKHKEQQQHIL